MTDVLKKGFVGRRPAAVRLASVAVLALAAGLAGCAKRDSITVGAVPDDYRTNHPIVIAEQAQVLDLAVGADDKGMSNQQKVTIEGFLSDYDRGAQPVLAILVPSGAVNDAAAGRVAHDFARLARRIGIPAGKIVISSYQINAPETAAPVRLTFNLMRAQTNQCGLWPEDILKQGAENKHYADFGCSSQNNLAAQIANPQDLLGPRKQSPIDATRRSIVIQDWQNQQSIFVPTVGLDTNF